MLTLIGATVEAWSRVIVRGTQAGFFQCQALSVHPSVPTGRMTKQQGCAGESRDLPWAMECGTKAVYKHGR